MNYGTQYEEITYFTSFWKSRQPRNDAELHKGKDISFLFYFLLILYKANTQSSCKFRNIYNDVIT